MSSQDNKLTTNESDTQSIAGNENDSKPRPQDTSMTSVTSKDEGEKGETQNELQTNAVLLDKLQEQVEFYFGDSNISKDRFLKNKMAEHPEGFVPVTVIASFNKMKTLTSDIDLIREAMERSPLLELSADRELVCRATPLPSFSEEQVNARTIYVENLSHKVNHKKLSALFSCFGVVTYVSLPRFKASNAIKGFAFIEFSSPEEANKAVQFFKPPPPTATATGEKESKKNDINSINDPSAVSEDNVFINNTNPSTTNTTVCTDTINDTRDLETKDPTITDGNKDPNSTRDSTANIIDKQVSSEATIEEQNNTDSKILLDESREGGTPINKEGETTKGPLKRKRDDNDGIECNEIKRLKTGEERKGDNKSITRQRWNSECSTDDIQVMRLDSTWSEVSLAEDEEREGGDKKKKKKVRKRKKRRVSIAQHLKSMKLKVLSKNEWLQMKVLFKQMQKEQMRALKNDNKKSTRVPPQEEGTLSPSKGFVSNCLVKVTVREGGETTISPEVLKSKCSQYGRVAYVDYTQGNTEGYVRYGQSGCVTNLIESSMTLLEGVVFTPVTEEEEREYFVKTQTARRQHYLNKRKRKATRGQDKVISRALQRSDHIAIKPAKRESLKSKSSHIRFTDSESEDANDGEKRVKRDSSHIEEH